MPPFLMMRRKFRCGSARRLMSLVGSPFINSMSAHAPSLSTPNGASCYKSDNRNCGNEENSILDDVLHILFVRSARCHGLVDSCSITDLSAASKHVLPFCEPDFPCLNSIQPSLKPSSIRMRGIGFF